MDKLAAWRRAWARVVQEQMEWAEREADRVMEMTDAELHAQMVIELGSEEAVEIKAKMTERLFFEVVQKIIPTKH